MWRGPLRNHGRAAVRDLVPLRVLPQTCRRAGCGASGAAGHGQLTLVRAGLGWWRQNPDWGSGSAWCCIKNCLWLCHGFALRWLVFGFGRLLRARCCMVCNWQRIRRRVCRLGLFRLGGLVLWLCCDDTNGRWVGRAVVLLVLFCRSVCRVRFVCVSFSRAFGLG